MALTHNAFPNRIYKAVDGNLTFGFAINPFERCNCRNCHNADKKSDCTSFLKQYPSFQIKKTLLKNWRRCDRNELADCQCYKYWGEDEVNVQWRKSQKLKETIKDRRKRQKRLYLTCESDVSRQVLGLGTNIFCCEGRTIDVLHPCDQISHVFTHYSSADTLWNFRKLETSEVSFCASSRFVNKLNMTIWHQCFLLTIVFLRTYTVAMKNLKLLKVYKLKF